LFDVRSGEGRIAPEEPADVEVAIAADDGGNNREPVVGAGDVAVAKQAPLQVPEPGEAEQRMVAVQPKCPL